MSPMHQARVVGDVHALEHSLVAAKMSVLRDKTTTTVQFRRVLEQIAILPLTAKRLLHKPAPFRNDRRCQIAPLEDCSPPAAFVRREQSATSQSIILPASLYPRSGRRLV
jgi:hypothetical protein